MVEYKSLRENLTSILEREIKSQEVYRNMIDVSFGLIMKNIKTSR